jgi:phage gp37-like protein
MYTITEIEDAIIKVLRESVMGSYCKKIDSYQIEGGDLEEQIRIFAGQLPCMLVIYSEGNYIRFPNKRLELEMKFSILVCAQNLRGMGDPRRGAIGTYKMIEDLRTVLTGQRLNLEIDPLFPAREVLEVNTKSFSAYLMEFKTKCVFTF